MSEERLVALERQVGDLRHELTQLALRLNQLLAEKSTDPSQLVMEGRHSSPPQVCSDDVLRSDASEEVLSWASRAALLPRISTFCFLMLVALGLRTITDQGLVSLNVGSVVGMSYAVLLMLTAWFKYSRRSSLAPVFACSGIVLGLMIVGETYARFRSLPALPAYGFLALIATAMAALSARHKIWLPAAVGVVGAAVTAAALDFPEPFFPYLMLAMLVITLVAHVVSFTPHCSWIRWVVTPISILLVGMWQLKLMQPELRQLDPLWLAKDWFLPVFISVATLHSLAAVAGLLWAGASRPSFFNSGLLPLNVFWASVVLVQTAPLTGVTPAAAELIIMLSGAAYLLVFYLGRQLSKVGQASLFLTGSLLLVSGFSYSLGRSTALPLVSLFAWFTYEIGRNRDNITIRRLSYAFQLYSTLMLTATTLELSRVAFADGLIGSCSLSLISLLHYRAARQFAAPRAPARPLLLTAALLAVFSVLRITAYQALVALDFNAPAWFGAVQTMVISAGAVSLMLLSLMRRDKEFRNMAVLVTVAAGVKVFVLDLFSFQGPPLLVSFFSFGSAAALASIMLTRWQTAANTSRAPLEAGPSDPPA